MCYVCVVGSSDDGLRLRQRPSSVPGRTRPSSDGAFAPCLIAVGRTAAADGGARHFVQQEGVVLAISGRHGHIIRLASYATPGYGESPEQYSVFFTPTTVSSRWRLRRCWTGIWRWRRGEWSQLPKTEVVLAVGPVLYGGGRIIANTQHKQSVTSISSRSCRPWRWCAQVTASQRFLAPCPMTRRQAVTATAAYSCDRTVATSSLRLGNGWRRRRRGGAGF